MPLNLFFTAPISYVKQFWKPLGNFNFFFHLVNVSFSNLLFRQSLQDNKCFCLSTGGVVVIYVLLIR